jgi:hypothetical protein
MNNLPIEYLHSALICDADRGKLYWRERTDVANHVNSKFAGKEALCGLNKNGYPSGKIGGRRFLAHRVIWAMHTGAWPVEYIDHINRDRSDNRICNLREASRSQNMCNTLVRGNNPSGFKGVSWDRNARKWRARIFIENKENYLGLYENIQDAVQAYRAAAPKIHKEFARF